MLKESHSHKYQLPVLDSGKPINLNHTLNPSQMGTSMRTRGPQPWVRTMSAGPPERRWEPRRQEPTGCDRRSRGIGE